MKRQFRVLTFDPALNEFTPQAGVRQGPYTWFGLRKAFRKLKERGYGERPGRNPLVRIEEINPDPKGTHGSPEEPSHAIAAKAIAASRANPAND